MRVLLVNESWFGNGRAIADAVASGIAEVIGDSEVSIVEASKAPETLPGELVALIVSSPTHELFLPTPKTRKSALAQGGTGDVEKGLAEWIRGVEPVRDLPVFAMDTCTKISSIIGSASKAAVKELKKRGFNDVHRAPSFLVGGTEGPLGTGELERARNWGRELAQGVLESMSA